MPADQNTPMQMTAPFANLDNRYFNGDTGLPWVDKAQALAHTNLQVPFRAKGLTVLIGKREYWFRDGTTDADLIPKGNYDVVTLDNADGSYNLGDDELVTHIAAKMVVAGSGVPGFKTGSAAGQEDITPSTPLVLNKSIPFVTGVSSDGNNTIYFSGVAGTGAKVLVKIYKN